MQYFLLKILEIDNKKKNLYNSFCFLLIKRQFPFNTLGGFFLIDNVNRFLLHNNLWGSVDDCHNNNGMSSVKGENHYDWK